ncbi:MAG: tetratricopeptide repeat protein [Terrimicrobiaceae bacterium]
MWQFFESFNDPRWRQERLFLFIILPIVLVVTAASLVTLLWEKLLPVPETSPAPTSPPPVAAVAAESSAPPPTSPPKTSDLDRGEAALNQGDFVSARIFLNKALGATDSRSKAFNGLGLVEASSNNMEKAVANFTEAIAEESGNARYFYHRSEALRRLNRPQEALSDLQKARQLDPAEPLYPNKLLLARMEAGEKAAVLREMKLNLELNLIAGQADWLAGAAAVEIDEDNIPHSIAFLQQLRTLVPPATFDQILKDRFFDTYRKNPEFSQFLSQEPGP